MNIVRVFLTLIAAIAFLTPALLMRFPSLFPLKNAAIKEVVKPETQIKSDPPLPRFSGMEDSESNKQRLIAEARALENERERAMEMNERDHILNELRRKTVAAALAYLPCDEASKNRFARAAQEYFDVYDARAKCVLSKCSDDARLKLIAFDSKLDHDVNKAINMALSRGGISAWDFRSGSMMAKRVENRKVKIDESFKVSCSPDKD